MIRAPNVYILGTSAGATGEHMMLDCYKQISGQAGGIQVPDVDNDLANERRSANGIYRND